jgi:hypothetical protein
MVIIMLCSVGFILAAVPVLVAVLLLLVAVYVDGACPDVPDDVRFGFPAVDNGGVLPELDLLCVLDDELEPRLLSEEGGGG